MVTAASRKLYTLEDAHREGKKVLNIRETADILRVGIKKAKHLIKKGKIPSLDLETRAYKVSTYALEELLKKEV